MPVEMEAQFIFTCSHCVQRSGVDFLLFDILHGLGGSFVWTKVYLACARGNREGLAGDPRQLEPASLAEPATGNLARGIQTCPAGS